MGTREELLQYLWGTIINSYLNDDAVTDIIDNCKGSENEPFGDTGPTLERMLASGASKADIALVMRAVAYEAVFGTLYALDDPGVGNGDVFMLHEELLIADPSGMEGRPDSNERSKTDG